MKGEIVVVLGFDMETDLGSWTPYYRGEARTCMGGIVINDLHFEPKALTCS